MTETFTIAWQYSENMKAEFLETQEELTIRIKDGYGFFAANRELFKRRLADPTKKTTIILFHPHSPHMAAVAAMDDKKAGHPQSQRSDCIKAIKLFQEIRAELSEESKGDCADRITFLGFNDVPPTVCFIGDQKAFWDVFKPYGYRGKLPRFIAMKSDPAPENENNLYTMLKEECAEIIQQAQRRGPRRNNLWRFRVPKKFKDLRRN